MRQYGKRKRHGNVHGHSCPLCCPPTDTKVGRARERRIDQMDLEEAIEMIEEMVGDCDLMRDVAEGLEHWTSKEFKEAKFERTDEFYERIISID